MPRCDEEECVPNQALFRIAHIGCMSSTPVCLSPSLLCADIGFDEGFKDFYYWLKKSEVPLVIISRYVIVILARTSSTIASISMSLWRETKTWGV